MRSRAPVSARTRSFDARYFLIDRSVADRYPVRMRPPFDLEALHQGLEALDCGERGGATMVVTLPLVADRSGA